ncbi:hypothetical protein OH77DRAFT_1593494, partial [Trametes cingulata]
MVETVIQAPIDYSFMAEPKRRRGRPPGTGKKAKRNQQYLRGQPPPPEAAVEPLEDPPAESELKEDTGDRYRWDPHSGMRPSPLDGAASDAEDGLEGGMLSGSKAQMERLREVLVNMLEDFDEDNPRDQDWLPAEVLKDLAKKSVGPRKAHSHGPVVDNKSARTQRRPEWKRARRGQTKLTKYNFLLLNASETEGGSTGQPSPVPVSATPS